MNLATIEAKTKTKVMVKFERSGENDVITDTFIKSLQRQSPKNPSSLHMCIIYSKKGPDDYEDETEAVDRRHQ